MILNAKVNITSPLKPAGLARNRISEDRISEEALYQLICKNVTVKSYASDKKVELFFCSEDLKMFYVKTFLRILLVNLQHFSYICVNIRP